MKDKFNRRSFLKLGSVAAAAPWLLSIPARAQAAPDDPSIITTREPGKLRLLGVTDLHYFWHPGYKDRITSENLLRFAQRWQPDAVIVCGDLWMNNPDGKGLSYCEFSINELEKLGLPWGFARGNHDQVSPEDDARARELLTWAPHSLYRGAGARDNYRVEVRSPGQDQPFWNLYLMNDAYPELHGFHAEQLEWFKGEAGRVRAAYGDLPAFAFFHIPLIEFGYMAKAGDARGVKLEPVTLDEGSPGAFDVLKAENQIRAMFCGHDHLDNFYGEYEGVHLEFLRATGEGGYGRWQVPKGATLIDLDVTGPAPAFTTATVMPHGRKFTYRMKTPRW